MTIQLIFLIMMSQLFIQKMYNLRKTKKVIYSVYFEQPLSKPYYIQISDEQEPQKHEIIQISDSSSYQKKSQELEQFSKNSDYSMEIQPNQLNNSEFKSFNANVFMLMAYETLPNPSTSFKSKFINYLVSMKFREPLNPFFVLEAMQTKKYPLQLATSMINHYNVDDLPLPKIYAFDIFVISFLIKFCRKDLLLKQLGRLDFMIDQLSLDDAVYVIKSHLTPSVLKKCFVFDKLSGLMTFLKHPMFIGGKNQIANEIADSMQNSFNNLDELGHQIAQQIKLSL